jgi:UDP-N-acetylmuramoyl-tripeptide--D-alanyl-D-alanine ligase
MKKLLQLKLKWLAKLILARYKPDIIGITGSAGKTSTKEAIYAVLSGKQRVRRSLKNYNNEIGVPLTIIGAESAGRSIFGWLVILFKAVKVIIGEKNYPDILILEMGVDRPGDMEYLKSIVRPRIGVITMIGPVHLEFFGTIEKIEKEKGSLITDLEPNGWAIVNQDDERSRSAAKNITTRLLSFGCEEKADLRAREIVFSFEETGAARHLIGTNFKLSHDGSTVPVFLPQVIGYHAVYAALAAAAVGTAYGMNLVEISRSLSSFRSPAGRLNLVPGIKNSTIIDDSYNSSPKPAIAALKVTSEIPAKSGKRLAILGDMAELGSHTVDGHREVGRAVVQFRFDILITVGEKARDIGRGAQEAGLSPDKIFNFSSADEAKRFIQSRIGQGDLVLVKGSQSIRMEKIVKEIMAEPLRASELLVRQDWKDAL